MKKISLLLSLLIPQLSIAQGTYIANEVNITSIANTNGNKEKFTIWVSGGTGVCINRSITFPHSAASSDKVYNRAYSAALVAFASGMKVTIHDYDGADCQNAAYIRLYK